MFSKKNLFSMFFSTSKNHTSMLDTLYLSKIDFNLVNVCKNFVKNCTFMAQVTSKFLTIYLAQFWLYSCMEFCNEMFWEFLHLYRQHCQNPKKIMMDIAKELHEIRRSPESRIYILVFFLQRFAKYIFDYNI